MDGWMDGRVNGLKEICVSHVSLSCHVIIAYRYPLELSDIPALEHEDVCHVPLKVVLS